MEEICKILGEYFQLKIKDKRSKTAVSIAVWHTVMFRYRVKQSS